MGRPPIGSRPMTGAEREARRIARLRERTERYRLALEAVLRARTLDGAKDAARKALEEPKG